jgi:tetratricopeptide (TPR) repeat protein
MADLIALGRSGNHDALHHAADSLHREGRWTPLTALELACAWALAGDLRRADHAYLEADQLDPSLALVPDVWGLWPPPPAAPGADPIQRQAAAELAARYRSWRTPDGPALWRELRPRLQADWRSALEPPLLDQLLVLGRATAQPGDPPLDPSLEAEAAALVADAEIAAEPAASHRFWQLMARLRPQWALARIRAADLALARGELEGCARWLEQPPAEALANPWFHDVSARHAVQTGAIDRALQAWEEAIGLAEADAANTALAAVFEQRRREARRGPGVLQVRSLANRGDTAAASRLLERLLQADPQRRRTHPFQPLPWPQRRTALTPSRACWSGPPLACSNVGWWLPRPRRHRKGWRPPPWPRSWRPGAIASATTKPATPWPESALLLQPFQQRLDQGFGAHLLAPVPLQLLIELLVGQEIKLQFLLHLLQLQQIQLGFIAGLLQLQPQAVDLSLQLAQIGVGGRAGGITHQR